MTIAQSTRSSLAILGLALGCAVGASMLPDDPYQRHQLLDQTIHRNARWIYERIHFDPTPIDVVVVGSSRVGAGISGPRLANALDTEGLPSHVVNFSLPEEGRDLHAAIFEDVLTTKQPKLLIIAVREDLARRGHAAYKYVGSTRQIATPAYPMDVMYPGNIIYLPYRQLKLFMARLAPAAFDMPREFVASQYRGANIETTADMVLEDGTLRYGQKQVPLAELKRGVRKLEASVTPHLLPNRMADIEYAGERVWIRKMTTLARQHNVKVAFLLLPYYTGPKHVDQADFYRQFGPLWEAGFMSPHAEWYRDYAHLTTTGAAQATDWLAPKVAAALKGPSSN